MALKLSPRQQVQLALLETLPPKLARIQSVVEQMGSGKVDDTLVRGMIRVLDETKAGASQLGMNGLADACGQMAAMARRGGGLQVKVRGLRDMLASVRTNYEAALKKASTPEPGDHPEAGEPA
jgi:hypothetical protein